MIITIATVYRFTGEHTKVETAIDIIIGVPLLAFVVIGIWLMRK